MVPWEVSAQEVCAHQPGHAWCVQCCAGCCVRGCAWLLLPASHVYFAAVAEACRHSCLWEFIWKMAKGGVCLCRRLLSAFHPCSSTGCCVASHEAAQMAAW